MTVDNTPVVGRFAPTPSGFLHLGNVFCSLLAWLYAKSSGGKIVLRIEDLDPQRCSLAKADALARELEWLGLTWDEGAYCSADRDSFFQSRRSVIYAHYFDLLQQQELVYPCFCSRSELHAAEAPHASDGRIIYAGTCRKLTAAPKCSSAVLPGASRLMTSLSPLRICTTAGSRLIWRTNAVTLSCAALTASTPTS